ncbi:MAG: MarR family transcriptional regulator [Spirochaetes bacterium]|nr:MarR family transcriptional regulator [Spirochaetota bacterium]
MNKPSKKEFSRTYVEEILYHALRSIYLFERAEIEQFNLNYQQMYLLKLLKKNIPFRISDIANDLSIPVFAATRLVSQLEGSNLIEKKRDKKDRRNIYVNITPEGLEQVKKIESHIVDLALSSLSSYSEVESRLILDVVKNLDVILGLRPGAKEAGNFH